MPDNPFPESFYSSRREPRKYVLRGEFFRDQTAIIHSMPFRRLKHKTQVFFAPENDHICTRIEHVMHVASIAATICKGLNRNGDWNLHEEMAYAIGLGHDLGHAPFGHAGEAALNDKLDEFKFCHELHSLRVVDHLANKGRGLNLSYGVRDGIVCHCGEQYEQQLIPAARVNKLNSIVKRNTLPCSYEGCIARFADKIAYLGRDIEDAVSAGFIKSRNLPLQIRRELGVSNGHIINTLVNDLIATSLRANKISLSEEKFELLKKLHSFNLERIYLHEEMLRYKDSGKRIISTLFDHFSTLLQNKSPIAESSLLLERRFARYIKDLNSFYKREKASVQRIVCDYIAGMTDSYILDCMKELSIPEPIRFR